jgi:hypothetical protein
VAKSELIAGKKALQAPLQDLPGAERLSAAGGDPFNPTGWFQGTEKSKPWKWEIDDSKAVLHSMRREGELGEILNHPELYKNYPSLAKMKVQGGMDLHEKEWGQFMPNSRGGSIELNAHTDDEFISSLLHEVQHAIQAKERGFAKGTSAGTIDAGLKKSREFFNTLPDTTDPVFSWKNYQRNMGEVEARTTQLRRKYTPEQRRQINPLDQEIPLEDRVTMGDTVNAILKRATGGKMTPEDQAIMPTIVKMIRGWVE